MDRKIIIENLQNTRDISVYLECLKQVKDRSIIILSTKHTPGDNISKTVLEKIHALGFTNFTKTKLHMYVGVISNGITVYDQSAEFSDIPVEFNGSVENVDLSVISRSWNGGRRSSITLNDIEYSLNERGLNIVIYDLDNKVVIDSCNYDAFTDTPTFYHKNLLFDEEYFNAHFFVPEKYKHIWFNAFKKKHFSNRELDITEINSGIVEPLKIINGHEYGGVCDEYYNFISGHINCSPNAKLNNRCIYDCYMVANEEINVSDETVVWGGIMFNHPGHLIAESIAERLWYLNKIPDSKIKLAVIGRGIYKTETFLNEFLTAMGIDEDRLILVSKPTKFKKVIVPDQCQTVYFDCDLYDYTKEYVDFFETIKKKIKPSCHKKIYLTKSKTYKLNIIGEDYFIDFYKKKGFTIINPEDYTIQQKAEFMLGADEVVTPAGTNDLYTIFCKPSARIVVLTRCDNSPFDTLQHGAICEVNGVCDYNYVNVSSQFMHKSFIFGLSLMSVTEEFKAYVKKVYSEDVEITREESLEKNLYNYLSFCPSYYTDPQAFNSIKNQKMLTVLQNMSEVFLGKDFDTSRLDLTTDEDNLHNQIKQLSADLDMSRKRVIELENSDTVKIALLLEETNSKLAKQISVLQKTIQTIPDLQSKIDELSKDNMELSKSLFFAKQALEIQERDSKSKEKQMLIDLGVARESNTKSLAEIDKLESVNSDIRSRNDDLQKQVDYYERSRSWRITKPLRSIAWFFRRLFGGDKKQ